MADERTQVLILPYELLHLDLYKNGAGIHLWDISVGTFSNWAKVNKHIRLISGGYLQA